MTIFDRLASFGEDAIPRWRLRPAAYAPRVRLPDAEGPPFDRRGPASASAPETPPEHSPNAGAVGDAEVSTPVAGRVDSTPAPKRNAPLASSPPTGTSSASEVRRTDARQEPQLGRRVQSSAPVPQVPLAVTAPAQALGAEPRALGENGRALGENGRALDENGQALDENGQALDENGQALDENGQALDENGQALDENGQALDENGQALDENGQALDENGQALGAADRIVRRELVRRELVKRGLVPEDREVHVHIDRLTVLQPTPPPPTPAPGPAAPQQSALSAFLQERGRASR